MYQFYKSLLGCGGSNNSVRPYNNNNSRNHHSNGNIFTTGKGVVDGTTSTNLTLDNGNITTRDASNNNKRNDNGIISLRAHRVLNTPSVTIKYNQKVGADLFDPVNNTQGFVDLGLAENKLCEDLITEKLKSLPHHEEPKELRYYPDVKGIPSFRRSLKTFIEREFDSCKPLDEDNIVVVCGLTALLDALAFSLGEEGDYIMTTAPYYYRIKNDLIERAGVRVLEVPLVAKTKSLRVRPYTLDVDILEEAFLQAEREGKRVKAVLIVNPNNPLGDVLTAQQISGVLDFAARYQLHVIVDEIYAMSVFDPDVTFTSVLALHHPDPDRVHFLWGFSKDFGLSGYRCGVLYSTNQPLVRYLASLGLYQQTAPLVQLRLQQLIDDSEWLHDIYFPTLRQRLQKHYRMFYDALKGCNLEIHPCSGGIFIWLDASKYLREPTFDEEMWLFEQFMKEKVFLLPGQACHSIHPGCFRIVFSLDERVCTEGIKRILNVLRRIRPAQLPNGF